MFLKKIKPPAASAAWLYGAAAMTALAIGNYLVARRTEQRHPPGGSFLTVDGVKLSYTDTGQGSPVVLIHGNVVDGDDWNQSGVADLLRQTRRVIIFDRPGYGHSERPQDNIWTAAAQAELIYKAMQQLELEQPFIVGHSWGAIVALELAARYQKDMSGLVLVSGYYFWSLRADVVPVTIAALPGIGALLRYTVSPAFGWLLMPLLKRQMFSPAPVAREFKAKFSNAMALRPSTIRAVSEDGALMIPSVIALSNQYKDITLPVTIMAGDSDKIVFLRQAKKLSACLPNSTLKIIKGAGHMAHYFAPQKVAEAVLALKTRSLPQPDTEYGKLEHQAEAV